MDDFSELLAQETAKFNQYNRLVDDLSFKNAAKHKEELQRVLDQLNNLEYSPKMLPEPVISQLVWRVCCMIPPDDCVLLSKFCQLVINTVSKQQLVLRGNLEGITNYLVKCVRNASPWMVTDLLWAISAVIYENGGLLTKFHETLLSPSGLFISLARSDDPNVARAAVQCIENITFKVPSTPYLEEKYQGECLKVLLQTLQSTQPQHVNEVLHCKTLMCAFKGIQNILAAAKNTNTDFIGPLMAALKAYTLFGLPGAPLSIPTCLYPVPASTYDPNPPPTAKPTTPSPSPVKPQPSTQTTATTEGAEPNLRPNTAKGKKGKKKKGGGGAKSGNAKNASKDGDDGMVAPMENLTLGGGGSGGDVFDTATLYPVWSKVSSSESEFSDTEGGQANRLKSFHGKVRQCALGSLHALFKATDNRILFGYWSSFLPDSPAVGAPVHSQTLFTSIMKDPSPRARTGALAVLTALVDGSKQYLMAAEESDAHRNAPFTPFSVTLGYTIKEIHRCLMLALVSENSPLAITQIIKCLATLMLNVPYHRLKPGLLTRLVKQIRPFLHHRDPNIRVACLTCLGSLAAVQAPLLEVCYILQPAGGRQGGGQRSSSMSDTGKDFVVASSDTLESGFQSGASSGNDQVSSPSKSYSPGIATPNLPSGSRTPSYPGDPNIPGNEATPWVVKLCIKNICPALLKQNTELKEEEVLPSQLAQDPNVVRIPARMINPNLQPLPVRLESLQVLAQLAKGYFPLIRSCLLLLRDVIQFCLVDKDSAVQLHGAKLLEELGNMILQYTQDTGEGARMEVETGLEFWLPLLAGPVPHALQDMDQYAVRATTCDALANIGAIVFEKMAVDKRVLCVTLLLGMTNDDDHNVRAAAVRALGVYVLYPCLREDVSFVADAANAVIKATEEKFTHIRVKAAWSLGNLSDALLMNKVKGESEFLDDFSDMLLLKLFDVAIKRSQDYDKVKANAVRALGNLLRYLPERSYSSSRFAVVLDQAIDALVKNITTGAMKVRWNACYAAGNLFSNPLLPVGEAEWGHKMFSALTSVVRECKNYKVRINAALALGVPLERRCYASLPMFTGVWNSLIAALHSTEAITDFAEYRYRDSLTEQVCCTLVHLCSVIEFEDADAVLSIMRNHQDTVRTHMSNYIAGIQTATGKETQDRVESWKRSMKYLEQLKEKHDITELSILLDMLALPEQDTSVIHDNPGSEETGFVPSREIPS